jgi:hypothetical protein
MTSVGTCNNLKKSTTEPFCDRLTESPACKKDLIAFRALKSMADGKDKYNIHIFKNPATEEGWCNGTAKYQHLKMSLQD